MTINPADDTRHFTGPLIKALHRHVDQCAASIPGVDTHDDHQRRQRIAAAWVYLTAVTVWAEDHHLIDPWIRDGLHKMPGRYAVQPRPVALLAQAMAGLTVHPATQWLMHPQYNSALHAGTPSDEAVEALTAWWANQAPSLNYTVTDGPESISGWIIGDLLQQINDERRKAHALAQTPWWVADFILDRTLVPACDEFRNERLVRTIDPTAGTGHMLIRAMDYLWQWYTTGRLAPRQAKGGLVATGGTPLTPAQSLPRLIASVDGVELDPLTAAVCRLRCTVYAAHLAHQAGMSPQRARLDQIPRTLIPRVGVADSLLLGKTSREVYAEHHPNLANLPGASFVGGDWDWQQPTRQATPPIPLRPATSHQQLNLFGAAA